MGQACNGPVVDIGLVKDFELQPKLKGKASLISLACLGDQGGGVGGL